MFGPSFVVVGPVSKVCTELLGLDPKGKPVDLILWSHAEERKDFVDGLKMVFSGKADADVVFDLLGSETVIGERTLALHYRLLSPEQVLIVVTDRSSEKRIEELGRSESDRRNLLLNAVSHRAAFGGFTREASALFTLLAENPAVLQAPDRAKDLAVKLHTLKGNAGFFEFRRTASACHAFEQHLTDNLALGGQPQFKTYTLALKKAYYEEIAVITGFLGERWLREIDAVSVPLDVYLKLEAWMRKTHPDDKTMMTLLQRYRTVPFRELFLRFPDLCQSLARQLGKPLHPVTIEGGDFPVLPDQFEPLASALVHLVRNMVDHGLESPDERAAAKKEPSGLIQIRITREADALFMVFSDDGRGIDPAKIVAKAQQLKLLPPGSQPDEAGALELIFLAGFSTAEKVTELSGRGVGLSAVKDAVAQLGGSITVHTRLGRGTSFDLILPVQGDRS